MSRFLKKGGGDRYEINLEGRRSSPDGRGLRRAAKDSAALQDYGSFTSLLNNEVSFYFPTTRFLASHVHTDLLS